MVVEPAGDRSIYILTLILAALATAAVELAIAEPDRHAVASLSVATGLSASAASISLVTRRRPGLGREILRPVVLLAMLALFASPFLIECARLAVGGRAHPLEVGLLTGLRNLGLGLAALAKSPAFARLAALVSLFLVLSASALGEGGATSASIVASYAVAGSLWLVLSSWRPLRPTGAVEGPRRSPAPTLTGMLAIIGLVVAIAAIGPAPAATLLAGFVPSSGGAEWEDPDARGGVEDGPNEVRASQDPKSVGFTDSDVYLDTDQPSLYDAFNDMYGEPLKPRKMDRMIALRNPNVQEQEQRPAENNRAGRQFAAVRRPRQSPRRPSERAADALVYVKGATPLHLGLVAYDRFDGRDWDEEPPTRLLCHLKREQGGTWFRLATPNPTLFAGTVAHQIKVGTLDSGVLAVPPHLSRFRIGQVDRADFFGWGQRGLLRMIGRTIPAGTVIDSEARTLRPGRLREVAFESAHHAADRHKGLDCDYRIDPGVESLARAWAGGSPRGWRQVEAIVGGLRRHAEFDRSATAPDGCRDVIGHFLLESRRGPDYLFATSAAVMLRSLDYPTRLVGGLYASPDRYDARTRHTPVSREDVHVWAEVMLPSGDWIAIEPTPGYELMGPALTPLDRLRAALAAARDGARENARTLAVVVALIAGLLIFRREAADALATLAWWVLPPGTADRRVLRSLRLLERRSRLAGCPRPPGQTPRRWYGAIASTAPEELGRHLAGLVALADRSVYAPVALADGDDPDIDATCRRAIRGWTLGRFRASRPDPRRGSRP